MHRPKGQMSETMLSGTLLAVAGGYLDVYTYIARGHVFANAQTGNMVLFGVNLAQGNWLKSLSYLIPILAFVLGIFLTAAVRERFPGGKLLHWRQITITIEIAVLCAVAFLPGGAADIPANTIVSFVCSVQVQSFRKINGNLLATTMCTGNLRSATECFFEYIRTKETLWRRKGLQYLWIIFSFILGAVIGSVLTDLFAVRAVLFACIPLLAVFILMFIREEEERSDNPTA